MLLERIKLLNFRNFSFVDINIKGASTVFLLGANGQGKTNFLEAIYCLCFGASFRRQKDKHLVKQGEQAYFLQGLFIDEQNIQQEISIHYAQNKKKILYNNSVVKDRQELLDLYPCIVFMHSDFSLLTGNADMQRQYLDQSLSLCFQGYLDALKTYNRCLRQKNFSLKQKTVDKNMLAVYNTILADVGGVLIMYRKMFVEYINARVVPLFKKTCNEERGIEIQYASSWGLESKADIIHTLNSETETEIKAKCCISGPHRDRILSFIEGYPLQQRASTGQSRILSLLLRIAQSEYYVQHKNRIPTYLFDDVLLEIDSKKQERFLNELPKTNQAFFTFLPNEHIAHLISQQPRSFIVNNGKLRET